MKDSASLVEIPLKVGCVNEKCKIVYITPIEMVVNMEMSG